MREAEHRITVRAPVGEVYEAIADVSAWPSLFPPTLHAEREDLDRATERIRLWATGNGEVKSWTSIRTLDPAAHRITFRQEVSQPPVGAMNGLWEMTAVSPAETSVRLWHGYRAVDDTPEALAWIDAAVDRNSRSELGSLRDILETPRRDQLSSTFEDSVDVSGRVADVYEFLYDAAAWSRRLPHVNEVRLTEDEPDVQLLSMDTRAKDGSTHSTTSIRICFPHERIVYKQTELPALRSVHTGEWRIVPTGDRLRVSSRHTVRIRPEAITEILGAGADVAAARAYVRTALGANSRGTLEHAKAYAEKRAAEALAG